MVILEARKIWKSLGSRIVLRGISLEVEEGERVVLLGANGSGKSTLLYVLSGVLDPDEGEVMCAASSIGFAPEKPDLPEHLLVSEWFDVVASLKNLRDARPSPSLGVDELRHKKVATLSLGQRQRVSLAAAWMGRPDILVIDEPTNGLDAESREAVLGRLAEGTALIATHDREVARRVATRIVVVRSGTIESPFRDPTSMGPRGPLLER